MKKIIVATLLCALCATPLLAHMEREEESSRWLKLSADLPFALFGAFIGKAEFKIGERTSLLANVGYIDPRVSVKPALNTFAIGTDGLLAVKFGVGGRWYPFKDSCMDGMFFEDIIDSDVLWTYSGNAIPAGPGVSYGPIIWSVYNTFHVGYSWVTDFGFFVDAAAGLQVVANLVGVPDQPRQSFYNLPGESPMTRLEARLGVGWAF